MNHIMRHSMKFLHLSNYINKISVFYTLKKQKNMFPLHHMADADFLRKQAPSEIFEPPKTEKSGVPPNVLFQRSIRVRSADCLFPGGATEIRTFRA